VLHATAVHALGTPSSNHSVEHILGACEDSTLYGAQESDWTIRGLTKQLLEIMAALANESISLKEICVAEVKTNPVPEFKSQQLYTSMLEGHAFYT